jgi:ATP-dependent exoDNAse (exonuclease V) alpha subunit
VHETSFCRIKKNTQLAEVLKSTGIIIWDEVPMQHRHCIEALDHSLREVLEKNSLFGGIIVLFGGDFRQTLPVVPRGSRGQIIGASLRKSKLWRSIELHHLHQNMCLEQTADSQEFAQWLLQVGAGHALNDTGNITLPAYMKCGNRVDDLIDAIYPEIDAEHKPDQYFLERTILSCKNDDVDDLNQTILAKFPGNERVLMSADSVVLEAGVDTDFQPYPVEFLNSLKTSGLPLAQLALKIGCPLMLLRNLDPTNGLCNGTRMILVRIQSRVLECRILGGRHKGHTAFIPRISLEPSNEELPIKLRRTQFPVRLAFSMTVNKSQGQSVENVGLDLRTAVFSHGQLYVALSRCTSGKRIKVLFPEGQRTTSTVNIVYPEVLTGIL